MAQRDLTRGSVPGMLLVLALPVMGSFILQSLYGLADLYFVGLVGGPAVAGLGVSLNTFFVILALGQTIGIGTMALSARAYGARDFPLVTRIFHQTFILMVGVGATCWLVAYLATDSYVSFFTADPAVHAEGVRYFRIYSATFLLQLFLMVNGYARRAVGDFITPTLLMALSVVANVVLDPLLIFGIGPFPELGIAGAAYATVIAQGGAAVIYLWQTFRPWGASLLVLRGSLRLEGALMGRMLRIGFPSGLEFLMFSAITILMYRFVRPFGGDATGGLAVGFRVIHSLLIPAVGIGIALSAMVGQSLGAGLSSRVRRAAAWGTFYICSYFVVAFVVISLDPAFWVGLFSDLPGILAVGGLYLFISGLVLPLNGLGMVIVFTAQGLGRTLPPLAAMTARFLVFLALMGLLEVFSAVTVGAIFWSGAAATAVETLLLTGVLFALLRRLPADRVPT